MLPGPTQLLAALALLLLIGCRHTDPFGSAPQGTDQPFDPGPPARLTLNHGPDRGAAWLPDGSGILYSAQQLGRSDHDVCLALIPPSGGTQRRLTCDLSPTGVDSTDAIETPAPLPDGRLAFVTAGSPVNALTPGSAGIALGSVTDPRTRTVLRALPYTIPGERLHSGASQLRWLGQSRLVYLGERVEYRRTCPSCPQWDTLTMGLDVTLLDVGEPGALPRRVPGTDLASGVSAGSDEDEVYYTVAGDARVFRRALSTGVVSVAHDFGPAGIARDVHVVGSRMAAVVGGRVSFGTDPFSGPMQWDSGGTLHVVDFESGTDVVLGGPGLFRRPQISPARSAIVAEEYPLIIQNVGGILDTTVSRRSDLYLFGQP
ncbi:MAG: TolB family protein [Gemmatimonadales bacterium]